MAGDWERKARRARARRWLRGFSPADGAACARDAIRERGALVGVECGLKRTAGATGGGISRHAISAFLIMLSMLPIVFVTAMIERYAVDVPYMDQWDMVPTMQLAFEYEGGPRLVDLRAQHCDIGRSSPESSW